MIGASLGFSLWISAGSISYPVSRVAEREARRKIHRQRDRGQPGIVIDRDRPDVGMDVGHGAQWHHRSASLGQHRGGTRAAVRGLRADRRDSRRLATVEGEIVETVQVGLRIGFYLKQHVILIRVAIDGADPTAAIGALQRVLQARRRDP